MKSLNPKSALLNVKEIFSLHTTSNEDEKIIKSLLKGPFPICNNAEDVTFISKSSNQCNNDEKVCEDGLQNDLINLTAMQLRKKYTAEANSHRNMLTRSKKRGNVVHPALRKFPDFLRILGPIPASGATLDRIDNDDPEYAPGKVRWADKRTQNNNKRDTLTFHHAITGDVFTSSRLAKIQGVGQSTIRQRMRRGWSDTEIINGARDNAGINQAKVHPAHSPTKWARTHEQFETESQQQSRSAHDIQFQRMAELFAHIREQDDEEALIAPPDVVNEGLPEYLHVSDEQWLRHFAKSWPQYRPHLIWERASPYHQRAIELIDPEYVKRERAKIARREDLKLQI